MDFEIKNWDLADQNFNLWLNGNNLEDRNPLTEILKSTFFVFKRKQWDHLSALCHQAFELFKEEEKRKLEVSHINDCKVYFSRGSTPLFLEPAERKRITKEENNRITNGILSGDLKVINNLYEEEFPIILKLIIQNSGNLDSAKDIFQEGLIIFIEKAYRKQLDLTCSIRTYLYSICRILWVSELRKREKQFSLSDDDHCHLQCDITVSGNDDLPDLYEIVSVAINSLGDPCQKLIESFYYKNLSWDEIAKSLGYSSASSARNQKYKCLERIRKLIGNSSKTWETVQSV